MMLDIMIAFLYLVCFAYIFCTQFVHSENNSVWYHSARINPLNNQENLWIAQECFHHLPQSDYNVVLEHKYMHNVKVHLRIIKQNFVVYVVAPDDIVDNVCNVSAVYQDPITQNSFQNFPGCLGHNYFSVANSFYIQSIDELSDMLAYSQYPITFIGHHTGGSVAYILAAMVKSKNPKVSIQNIISVGSSMPGDNLFMKHICYEQNIHCQSYIHLDDPNMYQIVDEEKLPFMNQIISEYHYSYKQSSNFMQVHKICRGSCRSSSRSDQKKVQSFSYQEFSKLYNINKC
jgi:hypothetical protein